MYLDQIQEIGEDVLESGCRDQVQNPQVLKNIPREFRQRSRLHKNDIQSLRLMLERRAKSTDQVLQKVFLEPKGVTLWSSKSISIFHERCKEDIIYLDATGSIKSKEKGSPPYYVYELGVRNPQKGKSPFPVATYLTSDHTTASVTYFLEAFVTDVTRLYGQQGRMSPLMIMCDGSMVLMQAISLSFGRKSLTDAINHYYNIASGQGTTADFRIPLLHRCLSHIMKNAEDMCRK